MVCILFRWWVAIETAVLGKLRTFIPDSQLQSSAGNELVYSLPTRDGQLTSFGPLFHELDMMCADKQHGIITYGVSDCTLEDVSSHF